MSTFTEGYLSAAQAEQLNELSQQVRALLQIDGLPPVSIIRGPTYTITVDLPDSLGGGGSDTGSQEGGTGSQQPTTTLQVLTNICLNPLVIPDFVGATSSVNGVAGLVPEPQAGDENKVLFGNGTWGDVGSGGSSELDAIAAVTGTGILRRTGPSTWVAGDPIVTSEIDDGAVTFVKMEDIAGLSVLGRSANSAGVMAALTATTDHYILKRSGTSLIWDLLQTANIADQAVSLVKQANFAAFSLQGNPTGSAAAPSAITLGPGLEFNGTTVRSVSSANKVSATLGSNYDHSAADGTFADVLSITLGAGTWTLHYSASFAYGFTVGSFCTAIFQLHDGTSAVAQSYLTAGLLQAAGYFGTTVSRTLPPITLASSTTIKLRVAFNGGTPTWALRRVYGDSSTGNTLIVATKE